MILKSQLTVGELTFDLRTAGEESDETVILLHGFPETSHMWTPLMKDLVKEGFYCIAPNQRG
jgi:pimeloyl-ACP methyl ester carboxylesterase